MTTPNTNIELGALPTISSYAASVTAGSAALLAGAEYLRLPEGVSTVTATGNSTPIILTVTTRESVASAATIVVRTAETGQSVVLPNVAVPSGSRRYLRVACKSSGDVGVTIITYPLS